MKHRQETEGTEEIPDITPELVSLDAKSLDAYTDLVRKLHEFKVCRLEARRKISDLDDLLVSEAEQLLHPLRPEVSLVQVCHGRDSSLTLSLFGTSR